MTLKTAGTSASLENGKSFFCLLTRLYNINRDQTSHVGNVEIKEKEVKCHVKVERRKGKNRAITQWEEMRLVHVKFTWCRKTGNTRTNLCLRKSAL